MRSEGKKEKRLRASKDYRRLLYEAYFKFRHVRTKDCPTWYDGCNCFMPFDMFDNEYASMLAKEMDAHAVPRK